MTLDDLISGEDSKDVFQIKIHLTDECGLRCKFCPNDDKMQKNAKVSSVDAVIKNIDFAINVGFRNIELGVLIGDVLNYDVDDFRKIIEYLESKKEIRTISMATSLVPLKPKHIEIFKNSKKVSLKISWYGNDADQYEKITGFNNYDLFINNINSIKKVTTFKKVLLMQMFKTSHELSVLGMDVELQTIYKWPNKVDRKNKGICKYIYCDIGILHNGDITLCAWVDTESDLIIGTIEDDKDFILKKVQTYLRMHSIGAYPDLCRKCDFFSEGMDLIE